MMRSLYSGVSGLTTHQTKMDVIGNNIANVNTVGFKSTAVTFSDIMYQTRSQAAAPTETTGGVNAKQIGLGALNAATKISISSGGASQTTGEAFDIKLTDSNATNFFIVNNGTQTLFTRAGSFYIDGSGNLAMTSTGYMVQGWQAYTEEESGITTIRKDTVSPLRLMSPENQTSAPEFTTEAYASGIFDKNDANIASNDGYNMSLGFYDDLGYLYTAKFNVNNFDENKETYSIKLTGIVDQNNNDILKTYIAQQTSTKSVPVLDANGNPQTDTDGNPVLREPTEREVMANIFGDYEGSEKKTRALNSSYKFDGAYIKVSLDTGDYRYNVIGDNDQPAKDDDGYYYNFEKLGDDGKPEMNTDGTPVTQKIYITDIFAGASKTMLDDAIVDRTTVGTETVETRRIHINDKTGKLEFEVPATNYKIDYNDADGSFNFIGEAGQVAVDLNLRPLGAAFTTINVDFSKTLSLNNNGSCSAGMDRGNVSDPSVNAGKKIGTLTGMAVQPNGMIYGSYDNGNTQLLGQIAVAQFANPSGLESLGNNLYGKTLNSGDFDGIGVDITNDGGKMETGMLEMSNVDLSREFTEMITTQRGFQANSRIITVSDTLLEELTNLKR